MFGQPHGPTLTPPHGHTGTGPVPLAGEELRRQKGGLGRCRLSGQKNPCSLALATLSPEPQTELGDIRTALMERGAWGQGGVV